MVEVVVTLAKRHESGHPAVARRGRPGVGLRTELVGERVDRKRRVPLDDQPQEAGAEQCAERIAGCELVSLDCQHFDVYRGERLTQLSARYADFFRKHL